MTQNHPPLIPSPSPPLPSPTQFPLFYHPCFPSAHFPSVPIPYFLHPYSPTTSSFLPPHIPFTFLCPYHPTLPRLSSILLSHPFSSFISSPLLSLSHSIPLSFSPSSLFILTYFILPQPPSSPFPHPYYLPSSLSTPSLIFPLLPLLSLTHIILPYPPPSLLSSPPYFLIQITPSPLPTPPSTYPPSSPAPPSTRTYSHVLYCLSSTLVSDNLISLIAWRCDGRRLCSSPGRCVTEKTRLASLIANSVFAEKAEI